MDFFTRIKDSTWSFSNLVLDQFRFNTSNAQIIKEGENSFDFAAQNLGLNFLFKYQIDNQD